MILYMSNIAGSTVEKKWYFPTSKKKKNVKKEEKIVKS